MNSKDLVEKFYRHIYANNTEKALECLHEDFYHEGRNARDFINFEISQFFQRKVNSNKISAVEIPSPANEIRRFCIFCEDRFLFEFSTYFKDGFIYGNFLPIELVTKVMFVNGKLNSRGIYINHASSIEEMKKWEKVCIEINGIKYGCVANSIKKNGQKNRTLFINIPASNDCESYETKVGSIKSLVSSDKINNIIFTGIDHPFMPKKDMSPIIEGNKIILRCLPEDVWEILVEFADGEMLNFIPDDTVTSFEKVIVSASLVGPLDYEWKTYAIY